MAAVPPQSLKPIISFLKLAKEYDKRDATVSYFCRMYAVQKGIQLDSKSAESKSFLFGLMDQLEKDKGALIANGDEAVSNEIVAQAHIETQSIDLFTWADTEDRNGIFDKKVTKAFYTASLLFEVLSQFGEQNDECKVMQKYSKWKATYLHRCAQTGEAPIPGPEGSGFEDELQGLVSDMSALSNLPQAQGNVSADEPELPDIPSVEPPPAPKNISMNQQPQCSKQPDTLYAPTQQVSQLPAYSQLDVEQVHKLLKYTMSALEYEDISSAVGNLTDAYKLLTNT